jgi:hypothetical protein
VPARPYFPVINGQLTDYARSRIEQKLIERLREFRLFGV